MYGELTIRATSIPYKYYKKSIHANFIAQCAKHVYTCIHAHACMVQSYITPCAFSTHVSL